MKLVSSGVRGMGTRKSRQAPTLVPGTKNVHAQLLVAATGMPSTSMEGQRIYRMRCCRAACADTAAGARGVPDAECGFEYGANGTDVHLRRCPKCQAGAPGEPLPERPSMLF